MIDRAEYGTTLRDMSRLIPYAKIFTLFLTIAGTIVSVLVLDYRLADTASVASFFGFILFAILDYLADRHILLAIYRAVKFLFLVITFFALSVALHSLARLSGITEVHANPLTRDLVQSKLLQIRFGFLAILAAFGLASMYALWKFKATRFAEGRLGLLKDLLIQVNRILGDNGLSPKIKREQALRYCLTTLLAAIELSPWQWLLRKLRVLKKSFCVCAVEILEPDPSQGKYKIAVAAYPKEIPSSAKEVLDWLEASYFPSFLNEARFDELVRLAKGTNPQGWRDRFFNFPGREEVVSAVGWIGQKKQTLLSHDSLKCRAFDSSYLELAGRQFKKHDVEWAKIRSFVGCPIGPEADSPGRVLFVTKSIPHGFVSEDREVVIAVSQVINSVLAATEPRDGGANGTAV